MTFAIILAMRNKLVVLSVLTLLHLCSCGAPRESPGQGERPPNIVLILADDLGYGELGAYGQQTIETPNLDALAQRGMRFTDHYSGAPVCAPARSILMEGKHAGHAWVRSNDEWAERGDVWNYEAMFDDPGLEGQRPIPDSILTVAEVLQGAGYKTGVVGKWGLGAPATEGVPNRQGFDFFYGYLCQRQAHTLYPKHLWKNEKRVLLDNEMVAPHANLEEGADPLDPSSYARFQLEEYAPELMHREALEFIERNREEPFFLYYASPLPHVPLQAPEKWVEHYRRKLGAEEPYTGPRYFPNLTPRATYAAMISYLDEQVGDLVEQLERLGLTDDTLIIFTSDNGPTYAGGADTSFFNSASPFPTVRPRIKGSVHEGGIRVPMIAAWPGRIQAGSQSDHPSAFYDYMATLAEVAGTSAPDSTDGISFLPTLLGRSQPTHPFLYWEFPSYNGQQAVRMGRWKGLRKDIFDGNLEIALYDLDSDPREETDLAVQNPEIVRQIREIMEREHTLASVGKFRMSQLGDPPADAAN